MARLELRTFVRQRRFGSRTFLLTYRGKMITCRVAIFTIAAGVGLVRCYFAKVR